MKRRWQLSVAVRVNPELVLWTWTWRKLALLRLAARDTSAAELLHVEGSCEFQELLVWCEARAARVGNTLLLVVPKRRLARFIRGMKELESHGQDLGT
jgi:hypothetical protein